jgi:hypothetical protein
MKRIIPFPFVLGCGALALALAACSTPDAARDELAGGEHQQSYDPTSLATEGNTQHHFQDPNSGDNGISEPAVIRAQDQQVGSPEVVARLHACSKIPYATLGSILSTRGVALGGNNGGAGALYRTGAAALGVANYAGRVPEAIIASTASMSKQFDILVSAAAEVQKNLTSSQACPGVSIADATGKFSKDGISCIMGKPATDAHVTLANQLVTQAADVDTGVQLAIAALLEAAHTCE